MRELSVREVIEHSEKIEQESYAFYKSASEYILDPDVKPLLEDLAKEEMGHYNHLRNLIDKESVNSDVMDQKVQFETDLYDRFIKTHEINETSTPMEVLSIALEREQNTAALYSTFLAFTNLTEDIVNVFDGLYYQELTHEKKVKLKMEKYK
jgi:rubrerythrin